MKGDISVRGVSRSIVEVRERGVVSEAQHLVLAIVGGYCVGERANTTRVAVLGFRTLPRASSRTHKAPSLLLK